MADNNVTVKGTVASVVFRNDETGYTVLVLELVDGGKVTCVGSFANLSVGAVLSVSGHKVNHRQYGEQIVADNYTMCNPTSEEGIVRYLSSGLIKGVGAVTAQNIYDMFGDDTFGVIENNPMLLSRVRGISKKKAMEIANAVSELKSMQEQIMFLQGYGMTVNLAMKIYNNYGADTKRLVLANPYRLVDDIDGIGFLTADKIAVSMGVDPQSEFRLRAAIIYTLRDAAEKDGNTYLLFDALMENCSRLLSVDLTQYGQLVEDTVTKLVLEPSVKVFEVEGRRCVSFIRYYKLESGIASKLVALNHDVKRISVDADSLIEQFGTVNKIKFHESQSGAVKAALVNGVTVITGGPGTGKTTIIKCIGQILSGQGLRVFFCAPTGRASKRITQSTGFDAKTIHRMLGFEMHDDKPAFKYNYHNQLPCDAVVVDEASMVDVTVMYSLLCAIPSGARLILVGDKDQLPSVGAGNVLSDVIRSGVIEIRYLTHIYRQSEDSLIVSNAHLINHGHMPEINNRSKDFFYINTSDPAEMADTVIGLVTRRLPGYTGAAPMDIQVLGALKSGLCGVENLNNRLQDALNPRVYGKNEINVGSHLFRVGDKVMQTANNYELPFVKFGEGAPEQGQGIFNGDIGHIKTIDRNNGIVEVWYDDNRLATYGEAELTDLTAAYAITIHKSQGSEFDVVVIPLVSGPPTLINRNLLYTAITRAKRAVVLVGSKKILAMMVHNNYIAARTTNLCRFLQSEKVKYLRYFAEGAEAENTDDYTEQMPDDIPADEEF